MLIAAVVAIAFVWWMFRRQAPAAARPLPVPLDKAPAALQRHAAAPWAASPAGSAPFTPVASAPLPAELAGFVWKREAELEPARRDTLLAAVRGIPRPPRSMQQLLSPEFLASASSADLSELTGKLSAFSSEAPGGEPQLASLELLGRAEGSASLEVTGKLNPLAQPLALDIQGKVRDLELPPLSPYSAKYAGYGIERGKLSVDVRYRIEPDGKLEAIIHEAFHNTSSFESFSDNTTGFLKQVYACPNLHAPLKIAATDLATPTWMRAPGAVSGMFALESAMDELAYALKIDPLELRLINYAEVDPESGKPFSSKALRECYRLGAEKFGWSKRNPEPRSMRDGNLLVGWGMASSVWGAMQMPASARVTYRADGTASVASATSDIGPGTYTVMTMIAAEFLGLTLEKVKFELGDTDQPRAPAQGGSWTTSSVGSAVRGAALTITEKLLSLANQDAGSPLRGASIDEVEMFENRLRLKSDATRSVDIAAYVRSHLDLVFNGLSPRGA